jgi:hypothetical protein
MSASAPIWETREATFNQTLSDSNVPIFADFWATYCGLWMIAPVLEGLQKSRRIKRIKIN